MRLLRPLLRHQPEMLRQFRLMTDPFMACCMRSGKTLVTIRGLRERYPNGRHLVLAPLTVLIPWQEELAKEGLKPQALLADAKSDMLVLKWFGAKPGWFLVGPAALRANPKIAKLNWDSFTIDESTLARNPQADITRLVNHQEVRATTRVCLSGWPCPEGEADWFEQCRFSGHGSFMGCDNFFQWRWRHFRKLDHDWVIRPGAKEVIRQALVGKVYFLSAAQAGMPNRFIEEKRSLRLLPQQKQFYDQMKKEFEVEFEGKTLSTKWDPVQHLRLHQIASGEVRWESGDCTHFDHKVKELLYLLGNELKGAGPVVVFFRFLEGVEAVERSLKKAGVGSRTIHGGKDIDQRRAALADWKNRKARVLLVQADCGKFALDLSMSNVAIFYSMGLSGETFEQCRQRLHHPLKKVSSLLIYFVTEGTLEADIVPRLRVKHGVGEFFFKKPKEVA